MSGHPAKVVIVGRDADLWLTATALVQALSPIGVGVTAIELPSRLTPASAYATLPAIETLHARLGIEEAALLRITGGSFSLGWNVASAGKAPFMLAHGSYGAPIDGRDFFPYWAKARQLGLNASLEDFSPTAMAARHGRILVPDESTEVFGRADYAYHLPAIAYAGLLKSRAQQLGCAIHQSFEVGVERADGGGIRAITTDGGTSFDGDIFVDASGTDAVLIGDTMSVGTEDWRSFFPFDRRLTAIGPRFAAVPAYGELRVEEASWAAMLGSQTATHVVHCYADDGSGDEAAAMRAVRLADLPLDEVRIDDFSPRLRTEPWAANCVAIGGSACALDPVFDLDLHAVQLGIVHLLSLFPVRNDASAERMQFNLSMRSQFERLRDFQAAVYALSGTTTATPPSLEQKIDAFRARGTIAPMEDETFSADQWRALFTGLGLVPESWPPSIDTTSPEVVKQGFRRILGFVHDKVLEQPKHDSYLAEIGAGSNV